MSEIQKLTTGEVFGRLYVELVANGVPENVAEDIVRDSAIEEVRQCGYVLRRESKEDAHV